MILLLFTNILGFLVFLFLLWKRLRDDYLPQQIFSTGFFIGFLLLILKISFQFVNYPDNIFIVFLALIISGFVVVHKFRFNTFQFVDSLVFSYLPWHVISQIRGVFELRVNSILEFVACIFLFIFYLYLLPRYKRFNFYKSGRIGFCGMTVITLYFLYRTAIAITLTDMLFFSKFIDLTLSLTFFLISALITINLSARKK